MTKSQFQKNKALLQRRISAQKTQETLKALGLKFTIAGVSGSSTILLYVDAINKMKGSTRTEYFISAIVANIVCNFFAGKLTVEHLKSVAKMDASAAKRAAIIVGEIILASIFASPPAIITWFLSDTVPEKVGFSILQGLGDTFLNLLSISGLLQDSFPLKHKFSRLVLFFKNCCQCKPPEEVARWARVEQLKRYKTKLNRIKPDEIPDNVEGTMDGFLEAVKTTAEKSPEPCIDTNKNVFTRILGWGGSALKQMGLLAAGIQGLLAGFPLICKEKKILQNNLNLDGPTSYFISYFTSSLSLILCFKLARNAAARLIKQAIDLVIYRRLPTSEILDGKLAIILKITAAALAILISSLSGATNESFYQNYCLDATFWLPEFLKSDFMAQFSFGSTNIFYIIVSYLTFEGLRKSAYDHWKLGNPDKRKILEQLRENLAFLIKILKNCKPEEAKEWETIIAKGFGETARDQGGGEIRDTDTENSDNEPDSTAPLLRPSSPGAGVGSSA